VATALLDETAPVDRDGVLSGILSFELARADVVLFAVSVDNQSLWGSLAGNAFRYVVADASDAIVNEAYPAALDGAASRTTQRGTWWGRRHGASPAQKQCGATLAASLHGSRPSGPVLRSALIWCGLARVASEADHAQEAADLREVLGAEHVASPVTSDLGPADTGWGPTQVATVTWRSSCTCFVEVTPFRGYAG